MRLGVLSRRQMLTVSGLLAGQSVEGRAASPRTLQLAGPADAAHAILLGQHFPDAGTQVSLTPVHTISAVLHNSAKVGIRAVAVRWTVTTAVGVHSEVIFHMMPAYISRSGGKSAGVARRLLLPPGRASLLTPATVLTSGQYARGYRPNLSRNLQRNLRRQFYSMLASTAPASAVTIAVEGVYYADGSISGVAGSELHQHVRLLQNAEHDQALSAIRSVREALSATVPKKLSRLRYIRLSRKGSVLKRDYQYARKQHARKFVKLFRRYGKTALVQHLETLLKYPKIQAGPETTA